MNRRRISGGGGRCLAERRSGARRAALLVGSILTSVLVAASVSAATATPSETDPTEVAAIAQASGLAGPSMPGSAGAIEARRQKTASELAELSSRIELSEATIRSLDDEIVSIAADRNKLTAAMKSATEAQRRISGDLAGTEARLTALGAEEDTIKASLAARRDLLAEVLAALERMGRKPPPALLVRPHDALGAVRSAILLGAVVPTMRQEAATLVADLQRLSTVKASIVTEKDRFTAQMQNHREEEARLERLFAEKQRIETANRERREAETARAAELARKADDLKGLIASLQADADAARQRETAEREEKARQLAAAEALAAEEKREAAAAREEMALARSREDDDAENARTADGQTGRLAASGQADGAGATAGGADDTAAGTGPGSGPGLGGERDIAASEAGETTPSDVAAAQSGLSQDADGDAATPTETTSGGDTRVAALEDRKPAEPAYDIAALRNNTALLEPAAAFSTLKARLSKPVLGRQIIGFGEKDDIGRPSNGVSFAARAGDVVIAPADGRVLYAGPFRSYGQLLILDAGDDYHIVLAGMDRIDVASGQFVSAGEPVALMGARRLASVQVAEFGAAEPALYVEFRNDGKPVDPTPWWTEEPSGRTRNDS